MVFICLMQSTIMCLLYKSHQIARLVSHTINHFSTWIFTVQQENATKFGSTNCILHIFLCHLVTSYGYIIVNSCIIWFNLNCIMQFKQFYSIATKVSSRKKCYYFGWSTWLLIACSVTGAADNQNMNNVNDINHPLEVWFLFFLILIETIYLTDSTTLWISWVVKYLQLSAKRMMRGLCETPYLNCINHIEITDS